MDLDIQGVYQKLIDISKQLSTHICDEEAVWCSRRPGIGQQSSYESFWKDSFFINSELKQIFDWFPVFTAAKYFPKRKLKSKL